MQLPELCWGKKWGQQLGRYTQTDSIPLVTSDRKTYRLKSAGQNQNFFNRKIIEPNHTHTNTNDMCLVQTVEDKNRILLDIPWGVQSIIGLFCSLKTPANADCFCINTCSVWERCTWISPFNHRRTYMYLNGFPSKSSKTLSFSCLNTSPIHQSFLGEFFRPKSYLTSP